MNTLFRNSRRKLAQGLLFWRESGQGTPVVFLHGAWHDSSQWVSVIESLGDNVHCFAPDLLGFGESENPNIHHSIDLQVECLAEFLQALRLEQVYLVGHSLGGWIASSYALKYPEKVSGLILLAPEGVKIEGQEEYWRKMKRLINCPEILLKIVRLLRPIWKILGRQEKIDQDFQFREVIIQYPISCHLLFQRQKPEIEAELLESRLHSLDVPCLILQGSKDTDNTLTKSKTYAKLLPKVELKMIAHAANDLPESSAGLVADDIRDFIKENSRF
ncbi:MAG TPA: alpha/beta hydrolase [Nostocaceae cyanobacterium]|nr:alpha/beta hydrolase [Nostocaceae cyanobacterium]